MAATKLKGPGRLPELKNLIKKTPEQMIQTLSRFGVDPDVKAIEARANRAFGKLERVFAEGIEPDEALWKSIEDAHEREMAQSLRRMTKSAIRNYRIENLAKESPYQMWVAVGGGEKSCPSCEHRHGKVKTLQQWRDEGLPGSAALLCGEECNCHLLPVSR